MSESVRPPALLTGEVPSRWQVWRRWLLKTLPGRALVLGIAIKAITWPLGFAITLPRWLDAIDMVRSEERRVGKECGWWVVRCGSSERVGGQVRGETQGDAWGRE